MSEASQAAGHPGCALILRCGDSVLCVHLQSTGAATAEQAQAIARLQKQLAESQDRRKLADESTASLKAEAAELRGELAAQTQNLAVQVSHYCCQLAYQSSLSFSRLMRWSVSALRRPQYVRWVSGAISEPPRKCHQFFRGDMTGPRAGSERDKPEAMACTAGEGTDSRE